MLTKRAKAYSGFGSVV